MKSKASSKSAALSLSFLAVAISTSLSAPLAHASTTSGTIDTTHKYAWSNVGGWVNFAVASTTGTSDQITVTDSTLTGYAWSANDGWINLAPAQGGVKNDGAGNLSGYAWDAGAGWVNFSGVKINSSGKFTGQATGGTVLGASYQINFDCANCDVETDWRPASSRTTTTTSPGSISPVYIPPPSSSQTSPSTAEQTASSSPSSLAHPSGLTGAQIQSILSLLTSFNVDAATIANVQTILSGGATASHLFSFAHNLQLNQTNSDVKALQQFLNTHGFVIATHGAGSPGQETTTFGVLTKTALIRFQKSHGLPATGWFGPMTRGEVNAV
ncbi:MAG: peptidoglycan-binding domain-containing protein [Minisyncoccota bacterium]